MQAKTPHLFEQMVGSLLGGQLATHVMEPLTLEVAPHQERIRFIVLPRIMEEIVLGLAWLDNWGPTIWWGGGCRHLRIGVGPDPSPHEQHPEEIGSTQPADKYPKKPVGLPEVYDDLSEVCGEQECDNLPPHHATDCAIKILPGAALPKPKMYSMTPSGTNGDEGIHRK